MAKREPSGAHSTLFEAPIPILPFLLLPSFCVFFALIACFLWPQRQAGIGLPAVTDSALWQQAPTVFLIICLTHLVTRAAQCYAQLRLGHRPPKMIRQIIAFVAATIGMGGIVAMVWDVPVGSLMTTSGLLVAVVGIALKNMISDLFNGVSLPVKIGDWVEVNGVRGRIAEISWRATKLVTPEHVTLLIPNTHFITTPIRNYSSEVGYYVDALKITLPGWVTAYQAERILVGAAQQVEVIAPLASVCEARISTVTNGAVEWELRYPVPDAGLASKLRHRIQRVLLRDLHYSGIALPFPHIEVHQPTSSHQQIVSDDQAFLSLIDLFSALTEPELASLCGSMHPRLLRAGVPVVRQGEDGDSLFIVQEGLLGASIQTDSGMADVGRIRPGQFFGEMSLLTGAVRSATVTPLVDSKAFEIDRDSLLPILSARPQIAAKMSTVLAERQLANAPKLENANQESAARESLATQILGHITAIFRLPRGTALRASH